MSTLPFLRYELRRHLGTLAIGLASLAMLPITQPLVDSRVGYWDGAWNVWGATLALYVLMPILVLAMAASGWARERSLQTIEWLYARPLSSRRIFAVRALAITVPALAWSAFALVLNGVSHGDLDIALSAYPGLPGPVVLFVVQLLLALGAGLFSSAISRSGEAAFRLAVLLTLGAWLPTLFLGRAVAPARVLQVASSAGYSHFLDQAGALASSAVAVALLAGAWIATRRSPGDHRAGRRALATAGTLVVAAWVGFTAVLHLPLLAGTEAPQALWLGGDRAVVFAAAPGLGAEAGADLFAHPVVREDGRDRILRSAFVLRPGPWMQGPWPSPSLGAAMIDDFDDDEWTLVEVAGRAETIRLDTEGYKTAIGWSPEGDRFAWLVQPRPPTGSGAGAAVDLSIVVRESTDERRSIRVVRPPAIDPRVAWIDDHRLLVTDGDVGSSTKWYSIVDTDRGETVASVQLPEGSVLAAPALVRWPTQKDALPTLAGKPIVLFTGLWHPSTRLWTGREAADARDAASSLPLEVATLAPSGALERVGELDPRATAASLGNLDDGTLVWSQPTRPLGSPDWGDGVESGIYGWAESTDAPRLLCTIPHGRLAQFRGQSGRWAVWDTVSFGGGECALDCRLPYELWGCNLETGATRRLDEWRAWAHRGAAIGERGMFTPVGWVPLGESGS